MKPLVRFLILCVFIVAVQGAFAQITITPTAGCAPASFQMSGPAGATAVSWTVGGGNTPISNNVISVPYNSPGTYNITYTAMVGGSKVVYNGQVVVSQPPTGSVSYVLPSSRCKPMKVSFSATGGSPGSSYSWAFGDLSPMVPGASVNHTYVANGTFTPQVVIIDAVSGCTAVAGAAPIQVSSPPQLVISSSKGFQGCNPPFVTAISGSNSTSGSPIPGPLLSYNWSFPGGVPATASGVNAGNVSFNKGSYTVSLSATDNNQCSSTVTVPLSVYDPSVTVLIQPTVCLDAMVTATVTSTEAVFHYAHTGLYSKSPVTLTPGTPTVLGNGKIYNDTLAVFDKPGMNIFTYTVYPGGSCAPVTDTVKIFVEKVVPNFTLTAPHTTCGSSMVVNYTNLSGVNTSHSLTYTWTIDGGNASNHGAPPNVYTTNSTFTIWQGSKNPYTIYRNWTPKIILLAKSNSIAGCEGEQSYESYDSLRRPTAWFTTSKKEGCGPLQVTFADTSFTNPSHPITGYTLVTGTSPPVSIAGTNTIFPLTYTYTASGTYTPYMIVKTVDGCIDTSFVDTIRVVTKPSVSLLSVYPSPSVCAGVPVQLHMTATPASSVINHWHVTTDLGYFSGCIGDSQQVYPFGHVGTHGFTVTGYQRGCRADTVAAQTLLVKGPIGSFRYKTTCDPATRKTVAFTVNLQEVQNATLNFGDNSTYPFTGNPTGIQYQTITHTYAAAGDYTVTLTTMNSLTGCGPRTFTSVVTVRETEARITYNGSPVPALPAAIGCKGPNYVFSGATSSGMLVGCKSTYLWFFNAPDTAMIPSVVQTPNVTSDIGFTSAGIYTVTLVVKDVNSCSDTTRAYVRVSEVVPNFSFNVNPLCMSDGTVQIVNNTQAGQVFPDLITGYTWNFGDGSPFVNSSSPSSAPVHSYVVPPGNHVYTVTVTATNNLGCVGTASRTLQVNNPNPAVQSNSWIPCLAKGTGATVYFNAQPGMASYSISYGDTPGAPVWVSGTSFFNHAHTYTTPGDYTVQMIVKDQQGCIGFESRDLWAIGQSTPYISFIGNVNKYCYGQTPTLVANVSLNVSPVTNFVWNILNAQSSVSSSVVTTAFPKGRTIVYLSADTKGFCKAEDTAMVIVSDPKGDINVVNKRLCLGDLVYLSLRDTTDIEGWKWFFGDNVPQPLILANSTQAAFNPTVGYRYLQAPADSMGKVQVTLHYAGIVNSCIRAATATVQVIDVSAAFRQKDDIYRHCLGLTDPFISTYRNPPGYELLYDWDYGDSRKGNGAAPTHSYAAPGDYVVRLIVTEKHLGCDDTSTKVITVLPLPGATLSLAPGMVCPEELFTLSGSGTPGVTGTLTGVLDPYSGIPEFNVSNTFTAPAKATKTTTFSLVVTDENKCESPPAYAVVQVPLPVKEVHWDTTVIAGQHIPIQAFGGTSYTYSWSPNTKDLSCITCFNPVSTTTVPVTYTVEITDEPLHCYLSKNTYRIIIDPRTSLDVPSAFTPNGDGTNDVITPAGWGIRNLKYFRVFNRWGQLIYETNQLTAGWDGTFNGAPQNTETYVYQVLAETYKGEELYKTGTFKLLR